MVGVLVIGLISGVIAATVFAVIPWAQDEAAKGDLDAVRTAQGVHASMAAQNGGTKYTNVNGLMVAKLLPENTNLAAAVSSAGNCYVAVAKSGSGKHFYIEDGNPTARVVTASAPVPACGSLPSLVAAISAAESGVTAGWAQQTPAAVWQMSAVSADGKVMLAGSRTAFYVTADAGSTWASHNELPMKWFGSADMSADGRIQYVGSTAAGGVGGVYRSTDYGDTWSSTSIPATTVSEVMTSADGQIVTVTASSGGVYRSVDGGVAWSKLATPTFATSGDMSADGQVIALLGDRVLLTSTDGGATWRSKTATQYTRVAVSGDGKTIVHVDQGSSTEISRDSGASWESENDPGVFQRGAGASYDGQRITTAGAALKKSDDAGATWSEDQPAGSASWLFTKVSSDGTTTLGLNSSQQLWVRKTLTR